MSNKSAVILVSGGMDSATAVYEAIDFTIPTFSPVGVSRSGVVGLTRRSRSSVPFSRLCTERCTSSERCSRRRNYTGSIIAFGPSKRSRIRPAWSYSLSVVSWPTPALRGSGTASPVGRVGVLFHLGTETVRDAGRTDANAHAIYRGCGRTRAVGRCLSPRLDIRSADS